MASEISRRTLLRGAAGGALAVGAGAGLSSLATPAASAAIAGPAGVDVLDFGEPESEAAHALVADFTTVVDGHHGDRARVAQPLDPVAVKGGELRFTMRVDPVAQNYFTLKFWGSDVSPYKTIAYIDGKQIGYRRSGDYEAINIGASSRPLVDRFYYNTILLPLEQTTGRTQVEITIRTYHGSFNGTVTAASRGYHRAYTHTGAYLDVSGEPQGAFTPPAGPTPGLTDAEKQALIDGYVAGQVKLFNDYSAKVDAGPAGKLSIVRYQDELRFYGQALFASWCPASTPGARTAALERILKVIDNHVKDYYGNTMLLSRGGHQGDWGGYYGALGEALYIVENLLTEEYGRDRFEEFLDQPFVTGTVDSRTSLRDVDWDGGPLTRRGAYERVLKANFDFARSRLSYIYNQVMYTYEGAWEAHEGLRIIGSRFYQGKARSHQIVGESFGWLPFLGEEVLVGPDGQDLDLFHSLFWHDTTARFTDDYVDYVVKGLARSKLNPDGSVVRRLPFGRHYTTMTEAGHTRENGYVANYGESTNYLPEWFYRTLGHAGDEALNDQILRVALKNLHARGFARYTDADDNGYRLMRMEMVVDERNTSYPGFPGYGIRIAEGKALLYASLEQYMAEHPDRYSGPEWRDTWEYAREAAGFAQQQLADNQYFNNFGTVTAKNKVDYRLAETYAYLTGGRAAYPRFGTAMAGVVHPYTDFAFYTPAEIAALGVDPSDYQRLIFVDIDNAWVSFKDGDTRIFAALNERQRGFAANGRLHVLNGTHDNIVQLKTEGRFRFRDYYARMDNIDVDFMEDQQTGDGTAPQALAGEIAPVTFQPGVGTVRRENFEVDHAYSGYPDLLTARYGRYFFAFNTTRPAYRNERSFDVELPADFRGPAVLDLVSGRHLRVRAGKLALRPKSAVVLKLTGFTDARPRPSHVDFVIALPGDGYVGVSWKTTAGAQWYTVRRDGQTVADQVRGTYFRDDRMRSGARYSYTVTAVNQYGPGWESDRVEADVRRPVSAGLAGSGWRDDRLGGMTAGRTSVRGGSIRVSGGNGTGLGVGDDYQAGERDINDSLLFVSRVVDGGATITARLDAHQGALAGLMLRDKLDTNTRYIYFGAGADGTLVLQNRTRDSRHDWQDQKRSPLNAGISGFTAAAYPFLRLARDIASHQITAFASTGGTQWTPVGTLFTPLPRAVHAGLAATNDAAFSKVDVR